MWTLSFSSCTVEIVSTWTLHGLDLYLEHRSCLSYDSLNSHQGKKAIVQNHHMHCALGSASMCFCGLKVLTNTPTSTALKCFPPTCDHAHTEHIVLICCTFPKSISSCFIRHLSWGSLAKGSGGSSSPVKSNQLSNTEPKAGAGSEMKHLFSSCQGKKKNIFALIMCLKISQKTHKWTVCAKSVAGRLTI